MMRSIGNGKGMARVLTGGCQDDETLFGGACPPSRGHGIGTSWATEGYGTTSRQSSTKRQGGMKRKASTRRKSTKRKQTKGKGSTLEGGKKRKAASRRKSTRRKSTKRKSAMRKGRGDEDRILEGGAKKRKTASKRKAASKRKTGGAKKKTATKKAPRKQVSFRKRGAGFLDWVKNAASDVAHVVEKVAPIAVPLAGVALKYLGGATEAQLKRATANFNKAKRRAEQKIRDELDYEKIHQMEAYSVDKRDKATMKSLTKYLSDRKKVYQNDLKVQLLEQAALVYDDFASRYFS